MEENMNFSSEDMDTTPDTSPNDIDDAPKDLSTTLNTLEEPLVTVKYNHNLKNYSLKEAAEIIQKNMHFDSSIKKLEFLATSRGKKLPELVNDIFEDAETKEILRLQQEFADDHDGLVNALESRKQNFERAFLDMLQNSEKQPDLNQRLADEFFELVEYFPEIESIEKIPDDVLKQSAKENKSLVLCFALHKAKEQEKLLKQAEKNTKNILSSAPTLSSNTIAGEDPTILAMLKGIRK